MGGVMGDFKVSIIDYWENFVNRKVEKMEKGNKLDKDEFHLKYFKY